MTLKTICSQHERVALIGRHNFGLNTLRCERLHDARPIVDFGLVGGVDFELYEIAIFRVHRAVAAIAKEGVLAFLYPARLAVCTVHHIRLVFLIDLNVLLWPSRALDDRGIDVGAPPACHLKPLALEFLIDPKQQHLVKVGHHHSVGAAAYGDGVREAAVRGLEAGEHHEVQANLEGMLQLRIRQAVSLAQQHQLEYRQRRVGLRPTSMAELSLVQTFELVRDLDQVQQLVQLHHQRALHHVPGTHQEEPVHASVLQRSFGLRASGKLCSGLKL